MNRGKTGRGRRKKKGGEWKNERKKNMRSEKEKIEKKGKKEGK